jgi:hypothetical protein
MGSAYLTFLNVMFPRLVPFHGGGESFCDCSHNEFVIESGDEANLLLKADSPVKGMFTARQETPIEKQLLALLMFLAGLIGLTLSIMHRSIQ